MQDDILNRKDFLLCFIKPQIKDSNIHLHGGPRTSTGNINDLNHFQTGDCFGNVHNMFMNRYLYRTSINRASIELQNKHKSRINVPQYYMHSDSNDQLSWIEHISEIIGKDYLSDTTFINNIFVTVQ